MKKRDVRRFGATALSAGIWACAIDNGLSATNYIIDTYPISTGATDVTAWQQWWGSTPVTVTFDPAVDADGDVNSGAAKFDANYAPNGGDSAMVHTIPDVPNIGGIYGSLEFDLLWSTNSALDGNGTYCKFNNIPFDSGAANWEWSNAAYYVPTNPPGVWQHVVHQFPPTFNPLNLGGWAFYIYELNTTPGFENFIRGPVTFWVDNVEYVTNSIAPAPPTLVIQKAVATPGINMTASVFNSPGQRQSIQALTPVSWVGSTDPVTYSFTITNFPDAGHSGFEARMLLVPSPGGETAPEHNNANAIYLRVVNNANGTATASFRYKTNWPQSSGNITYDPGTLAVITNATALGKWSLTFNNDTNISLVTPSGTSTNFVMLSDTAAMFGSSLNYFLGISPTTGGNISQSAVFSHAQILTGTTTNLDDSFLTAPLDLAVWQKKADAPDAVFVWPADATYWVTWTLPDTGFQLQSSTDLTDANSWADPLPATLFQNNIQRSALLTNSPAAGSYYRLLQTP